MERGFLGWHPATRPAFREAQRHLRMTPLPQMKSVVSSSSTSWLSTKSLGHARAARRVDHKCRLQVSEGH
jgi:hypothetical protein